MFQFDRFYLSSNDRVVYMVLDDRAAHQAMLVWFDASNDRIERVRTTDYGDHTQRNAALQTLRGEAKTLARTVGAVNARGLHVDV